MKIKYELIVKNGDKNKNYHKQLIYIIEDTLYFRIS
jgi:hypothetical protein